MSIKDTIQPECRDFTWPGEHDFIADLCWANERYFTKEDLRNPDGIYVALAMLDPREKLAVEMKYGIGEFADNKHTYKAIGVSFGVSGSRASQICTKAMRKLRHPRLRTYMEDNSGTVPKLRIKDKIRRMPENSQLDVVWNRNPDYHIDPITQAEAVALADSHDRILAAWRGLHYAAYPGGRELSHAEYQAVDKELEDAIAEAEKL